MNKTGRQRVNTGFSREIVGKRATGRPRRRWEDNIKMDLRETDFKGRR